MYNTINVRNSTKQLKRWIYLLMCLCKGFSSCDIIKDKNGGNNFKPEKSKLTKNSN